MRIACLLVLLQVSFHAADWPQFRGPTRDGQSPEAGLLQQWPEPGPRLLHTISGIGGDCGLLARLGEKESGDEFP